MKSMVISMLERTIAIKCEACSNDLTPNDKFNQWTCSNCGKVYNIEDFTVAPPHIRTIATLRIFRKSGLVAEVLITYHIYADKNDRQYIQLHGGPSGYESAAIDDLRKRPQGWMANCLTKDASWEEEFDEETGYHQEAGFKAGYDGLFIPGSEIQRMLTELDTLGM
jgi:hypothetical protein